MHGRRCTWIVLSNNAWFRCATTPDFVARRAKIALSIRSRETKAKVDLRASLHVNRAWIYHEGGMTISAVLKATQKSQSPYSCFQSFQSCWLANGDCSTLWWCASTRNCRPWGLVEEKDSKKRQFHWWQKQPYPHSELSVKEIILKNTAILTKFLKNVERNEIHVDLVLNCCELIQRKKTWGQHKRTALTQSFALPCSDIPSLLKRGLTSLPTMLVIITKSYRVYEVVVVQLKRQGFVKVNHREPIK